MSMYVDYVLFGLRLTLWDCNSLINDGDEIGYP